MKTTLGNLRRLGTGLALAALVLTTSGCEVMGTLAEGAGSYLADENAKRQDDPAAYQACDHAYEMCKQAGGFGTASCESQRSMLTQEGIYCPKVAIMSGTRGR